MLVIQFGSCPEVTIEELQSLAKQLTQMSSRGILCVVIVEVCCGAYLEILIVH